MNVTRKHAALGGLIALSIVAAACGSSSSPNAAGSQPASTVAASPTSTSAAAPAASTAASGATAMSAPFGTACSSVPKDGAGSFAGMAQDPAATAASNNPVLSTLVTAVKAAGLVDTLNGPGPFTIFAPTNDAFAKVDKATLTKLLADPKGDLTKVLTYHVIAGKNLDPDTLAKQGMFTTVNGGTVTVTKTGDAYKVNDATVVCAGVHTANATVYIIDSVLTPKG